MSAVIQFVRFWILEISAWIYGAVSAAGALLVAGVGMLLVGAIMLAFYGTIALVGLAVLKWAWSVVFGAGP